MQRVNVAGRQTTDSEIKMFYFFIPSSELNAYLKQIKVIVCSEKISYFFTSDE